MKPCIVRNNTTVRSKYFANSSMQNDKSILENISKSDSPLAPLAKELSALSVGHIPVHLKPSKTLYDFKLNDGTDTKSVGAYYHSKNIVEIAEFSEHGNVEALIIHEILHGMTHRELRKNTKARNELNSIYNQALNQIDKFHPNSKYGLENLDEFIVAIYTNPHFIRDMQSIPGSTKGKALYADLLDFFKNLFKMDSEKLSLFEDAFTASNLILDQFSATLEEDLAYEKERVKAMADYNQEPILLNIAPDSSTDLEKKFKLRNKDGSRKRFPSETKAVDKARKLNKANRDTKFSTMKVMGEKGDSRTYYAIKATPRALASPVQVSIDGKPSLLFGKLESMLGNPEVALKAWAKTQTADFKAWFEGSTVVDENGEPMIVYPTDNHNEIDPELTVFSTEKGVDPMYLNSTNPTIDSNGNIVVESTQQIQRVFSEPTLDLDDGFYDPLESDNYYDQVSTSIISDFSKLLYFKEDQLILLKNRLAKVKAGRKDAEKMQKNKNSQLILKKLIKLQAELEKRIGHVTDRGGAGLVNEIAQLNSTAGVNSIKTFAEKDFERLDKIINSGNIHDLRESAQIIEFYKSMYPPSVNKVHPIFTKEEMFNDNGSPKLSDFTWDYYAELSKRASEANNILETKQQKELEAIVNRNQGVKELNSVKLTYADMISKDAGLADLNWFDMMTMDITMGIFSTNGVMPQVMFASLQDSVNRNMAAANILQEQLDEMQPAVEAELKKLGQDLSVFSIKGVSYEMFKQVSNNGFETGRIINRYSTNFYNNRKGMDNTFRALIKAAKQQEDPSIRNEQMTNAFEWRRAWYRGNTIQLELGKIPEIANDPRFSRFGLSLSTDTTANAKHIAQLKEHLGQKGYEQEVAKQVKALERYMNDYDAHADMLTASQLQLFEKENSPFVGNDYFHKEDDIKHFDKVVRPGMKYNVSIPRKFKGDVKSTDASGRYKIVDSQESLNNYDTKFKEVEKNDVLFKYHNLLTEVNKKIRDGLPVELQEKLQINSLPEVEKSITELLMNAETPMDAFNALAVAFWKKMGNILSVKVQNHISNARKDPLTGKTNYKVNDAFFTENNRKINMMLKVEAKRMADALGIPVITDYTSIKQNELTPDAINLLAEYLGVKPTLSDIRSRLGSGDIKIKDIIRESVTHQAVQQKSFDLPKVMKMYLNVAAKYKAKNDALPLLEIMKKHYETIKSTKTNNIGTRLIDAVRVETEVDGLRTNAITQMDDWFNRVVLDNHGKVHSGVNKVVQEHIGDETKRTKRWLKRIKGVGDGKLPKYLLKEEKELVSKIDKLIQDSTDPDEVIELQEIKESIGRHYSPTAMLDSILNFIRFKALGFNLSSSMTNLMEGELSNLMLTHAGDFFNEDQYWRANSIARKSMVKNIFGKVTKGKIAPPDAVKLRIIMDKTQILQDSSNELQRSSAKSTYAQVGAVAGPYELNKRTEYLIQTPIVIASMMNEVVIGIDGEVSNAWDALDVNGKLKANFRTSENIVNWERMSSQKFSNFKNSVGSAITLAHGNYDELRGMLIKKGLVGKAMMMFKSWLPNAMYTRFAVEQDNIITRQKFKGRYRSFTKAGGSTAGAIAAFSLFGATFGATAVVPGMIIGATAASFFGSSTNTEMSYVKDLLYSTRMVALKAVGMPLNRIAGRQVIKGGDYTEFVNSRFSKEDARNMNANMVELATIAQKLLLMVAVKGMWWDEEDDPDDPDRLMHNFFMNKFQSMLDSFTLYISSPSDMYKTFFDGAFMKFTADVKKTMLAFGDWMDDMDEIGTGMNRGESKLYNQTFKTFVPGIFKDVTTLGLGSLQQRQFTEAPVDRYFVSENKESRTRQQKKRAKLKLTLELEGKLTERQIKKKVNKDLPMPKKTKKKE